ncbi:MAG: hypothetical protein KC591_15405, partial [Gemmatimonadetes bacterium]|nr:hypothetical protein [Gemmatimonadota bacterium]
MTPPLRPVSIRRFARGETLLLSMLLATVSPAAATDAAHAPPAAAAIGDAATALEPLARLLRNLPAAEFPCLQDRGLPLAPLSELDGSPTSRAVSARLLRQVADDLARMAAPGELTGDAAAFRVRARAATDVVPLGLIRATTSRLAPDALTRGDIVLSGDRLLATGAAAATRERVVAAGALADHAHRGQATFVLRREFVLGNEPLPALVEIDFDDGRGWRAVLLDEPISVRWTHEGTRTFRWRVTSPDGDVDHARSTFDVAPLGTPVPDDTLQVTGVQSWQGATGTGDGYVYLAPGHATITNPAIVLEGFDLDDTMYWEELYVLLNQQNLLEDLRTDGYDAVVLNFTQATDPIPRNAFVAVDLIQQVLATIDPQQDVFVIGASMGGLVGRYALSWMEQQAIPHRTRTFLTYDTPHDGANIPLGIQYWLSFFSGLSSEASFLLGRLDTPAARQMLVVHHTDPPDGTPEPDPARAQFLTDLAAVGDWP